MIEWTYYLGVPVILFVIGLIVWMFWHEGREDRDKHRRYYEETRVKPPTRS